jgi:UDP-glucose 4-epimerase
MTANGWKGRKVLVTGADGFIGSHLAEALAGAGAKVTALALYNSFDRHGWLDEAAPELRDKMTLARGDIRDAEQMRQLCRGQEVVFHLAALISVPYSYAAPSSFVATNVQGTLNVLTAAKDAGAARIIHTSTSEVYGTARTTPITEDHVLQAQSPYAASKIAADAMALSFTRTYQAPVVTLRPFNTYGPRQSERAVIGAAIRQALDPTCDAIRLGDLRPGRAFGYVTDTVAAFLAVGGGGDAVIGNTYNAGSDRMISIGELAELIRRVAGCNKPVLSEDERRRPPESEVMALMADSSRLVAATGWKPSVTLEDGIARTIAWWRGRIAEAHPDARYVI